MEVSKSAALMDDWRNYLRKTNGDIFEIITTAIMVAATDHPHEFRTKRDTIAHALFSGCDTYKKQSTKVSHGQTEDETKKVGEVLTTKEILAHESESVLVTPSKEKEAVPNCKQKRSLVVRLKVNTETKLTIPKGPVTPEKNINDLGARVYNQGDAEVLRMKKILEKSGDESESEAVVCDLLMKLQSMGLLLKTLEATMIGRTVNTLKNHASEKVRKLAVKLVKEWKHTVEECLEEQSQKSLQKAPKIVYGRVMASSEKSLDAAKRKLHEGYEKVENMKKKRRIQVLELHEVATQGLLSTCIDNKRRKFNGRC